jgi:hypothetical protein
MVTVRTYSNPNQAALAKSLPGNYEIPCALLHEHANVLYPLAMPVRLLVEDGQADLAMIKPSEVLIKLCRYRF